MQVYKAYFKIMKQDIPQLSIYVFVFLIMSIVMSNVQFTTQNTMFSNTKTRVAIIDRDEPSEFLNGFKSYISANATIVEIEDNEDKLQDALFFRDVSYIITIPAGFTRSFLNDGLLTLQKTIVPETNTTFYTDMLINRYLNTAKLVIAYDLEKDWGKMNATIADDVNRHVDTNILARDVESKGIDSKVYLFNYLAYSMFAIFILGVGTIMTVFNQPDLKRRNRSSMMKPFDMNKQIFIGNLTFLAIVWGMMMAMSIVIYGKNMLTLAGLLLAANSLLFSITALAISFLIGTLVPNQNALSAIANVVSLGFCFISGVFVPQEILGQSVLKVASFTPTFWFVKVNDTIGSIVHFNKDNLMPIFGEMLIQVAFAVAVLGVALVFIKQKRTE